MIMPNFESNKQQVLIIPVSRFKLGDNVQWSLNIPGKDIVFYGYISAIFWNHELGDKTGYWSYAACLQFRDCNGLVKRFDGYDDVDEPDLRPWKGDGTDTKIGSGGSNMSSSGSKIDTKIMLQ